VLLQLYHIHLRNLLLLLLLLTVADIGSSAVRGNIVIPPCP